MSINHDYKMRHTQKTCDLCLDNKDSNFFIHRTLQGGVSQYFHPRCINELMDAEEYFDLNEPHLTNVESLAAKVCRFATQNRSDGTSPLMHAVKYYPSTVPPLLVESFYSDVNLKDDDGMTALMYAALFSPENMVYLLAAGANVNATDTDGMTALMHGLENDPKYVRELLDAGAEVNAIDKNGMTALMHGMEGGSREALIELLDAGAEVNAIDKNGMTAFAHGLESLPRDRREVLKLSLPTEMFELQ